MVKIACSLAYSNTYASEYIRGIFDKVTFMRYKRHNIAIPNIELRPGETVVIEELSNRRYFWNRNRGNKVLTKYTPLTDNDINGVGFEIYEVVRD